MNQYQLLEEKDYSLTKEEHDLIREHGKTNQKVNFFHFCYANHSEISRIIGRKVTSCGQCDHCFPWGNINNYTVFFNPKTGEKKYEAKDIFLVEEEEPEKDHSWLNN